MNLRQRRRFLQAERLSEGVRNSHRETEMTFVACIGNLTVKEGHRMRVAWMARIVVLILVAVVLGIGSISAARSQTIVVYSGMDEYRLEVLTKVFKPKTGIKFEPLVLAAAGSI